ncbi:hypothetical protein [Streptomyces sp. NPDC087300]|uniref:hypothetical protein n=1 Tax=Streptomyces sp. NPDC087300 TaxID=3365780 RepID=UPI00380FAA5B
MADGPAAWDRESPRAGVLAIGTGVLHLRGVDGGSLDIPFADLVGVVCIASSAAWLDPTLDLLLRSGDAIELRTAHTAPIAEALSGEGVQTVPAQRTGAS